MKKVRKIMVGFDFSDYSKEALQFAAEMADELNSDLMVANVINQRDINVIEKRVTDILWSGKKNSVDSAEEVIKSMKKSRLERINKIIEDMCIKNLPVEIKLMTGVQFQALIQAVVNDESVDLVVIGQKGRGDIKSIVFGTTAEKMFRNCPVPLLSLRKDMRMII